MPVSCLSEFFGMLQFPNCPLVIIVTFYLMSRSTAAPEKVFWEICVPSIHVFVLSTTLNDSIFVMNVYAAERSPLRS